MTLTEKIKSILNESYPGMGRSQEAEPQSQGGSVKPNVEILNKGVHGGSTPNKSAAPLAAGAGPMDKTPPKQGDSKDADKEELDPNAPGKTAGAKKKKMPVPTATGAGAARNFSDAVDPVSAVAKRATKGNVLPESAEELDEVEDVTEEEAQEVDVQKEIEALFADEEGLSEDFKVKAASMFAALVEARVAYETDLIEQQLVGEAEEAIAEHVNTLAGAMDEYLNTVVENFVEENTVVFEQMARVEIAESFIESLKDLFEDHYIEVPEARADIFEDLIAQVDALEAQLDEATEVAEGALQIAEAAEKQVVFMNVTEGMTDLDREKLFKLVENVEFGDEESFAEKVSVIKENYIGAGSRTSSTDILKEDFDVSSETDDAEVSAEVAAAVAAISRTVASRR
jgi:hypothetical protein